MQNITTKRFDVELLYKPKAFSKKSNLEGVEYPSPEVNEHNLEAVILHIGRDIVAKMLLSKLQLVAQTATKKILGISSDGGAPTQAWDQDKFVEFMTALKIRGDTDTDLEEQVEDINAKLAGEEIRDLLTSNPLEGVAEMKRLAEERADILAQLEERRAAREKTRAEKKAAEASKQGNAVGVSQ